MGLLSFLFGRKEHKDQKVKKEDIIEDLPANNDSQNIKLAKENDDLVKEGVEFHATLQLRTPLWILKKDGEVHTGTDEPPQYGNDKDGVWLPKLSSKFDFLDEGSTSASDAMGSVSAKKYLNYAIGLLTIFEQDITIHEKMLRAGQYAESEELQIVERYILKFYSNGTDNNNFSIADVMGRFINTDDRLEYFSDKENYLSLVNGVNKTIERSLIENEIKTINELQKLTSNDLVKLKGIGKISAEKIINFFQ